MSKRELATYLKKQDVGTNSKKWLYFAAGYPEKAEKFARKSDADLFGCKRGGSISMGNIIPVELKATPNYARCLEQADIKTKKINLAGREVRIVVQKER